MITLYFYQNQTERSMEVDNKVQVDAGGREKESRHTDRCR